jgi:Protein of unknown function (DUF3987)
MITPSTDGVSSTTPIFYKLSTEDGITPEPEILPTQDSPEVNPQTPGQDAAQENDERDKDEFDGLTNDEIKQLTDAQIYKRSDSGFPEPMATPAFDGVMGKIVNLVTGDQSELCREAVVVQTLVMMGNIVGRESYFWQEAEHHTNEFAVIVGRTSSGAKGGSIRAVKSLLKAVDIQYVIGKCSGGFQSGEAVVDAIRDEYENIHDDGEIETIPGVDDKRLMMIEEEFSRLLKLGARQGSILSEIMRCSFDSDGELRARSKKHPAIATYPHVSLIGHITPEELQVCMKNADVYNGFANRILWCASKRARKVPRPKRVNWANHADIVNHIKSAISEFGPNRTETVDASMQLDWSEEALDVWDDFYMTNEAEAESTGGALSAVVARGKAHVLRLSMIYAILARSWEIQPDHVESAKAVWEYCKASARWAFGDSSGNRLSDTILWALKRRRVLTRTQINTEVCRGNITATEIDQALGVLRESGLADFTTEKNPHGGRPKETWSYAG